MFETIQQAPPDAILGLNEAFRADTRDDKINLTIGVYQDETGLTPILESVKEAERRLLGEENTKRYLGIDGLPEFRDLVPKLLLGEGHEVIGSERYATFQTPGGTGALKVAADFIRSQAPQAAIWCSQPTWANHHAIFQRAGLEVQSYDYLDSSGLRLDFDKLLESLTKIPNGDVVCLHACCHNPTGVDPTPSQWEEVAKIVHQRKLLPLFDAAYQGFGNGLEPDAWAIRHFAAPKTEAIVCSSYSKNFGLYGERVGAMTLIASDQETAKKAQSQAKACVRSNYSNPPKHGGAIVAEVLKTPELRTQWEKEVAQMCSRIQSLRQMFVEEMKKFAPDHDFSFVLDQKGMFSYSGLNRMQVDRLQNEFAIYIVGSGRINVASINKTNLTPLCKAIAAVL